MFDDFRETGMTGVAAQMCGMCGDRNEVASSGYQIRQDGTVVQEEIGENAEKTWIFLSRSGARRTALNDLSRAAAYTAHDDNTPVNQSLKEKPTASSRELKKNAPGCFQTKHPDRR